MKIFVYNYREFDEAEYFEKFSKEYHVELGICKEAPSLENAYLVKGYEYVSIITTKIDRPLFAGMCGGLYDDAYFDVDPKNETDHAEGGDQ